MDAELGRGARGRSDSSPSCARPSAGSVVRSMPAAEAAASLARVDRRCAGDLPDGDAADRCLDAGGHAARSCVGFEGITAASLDCDARVEKARSSSKPILETLRVAGVQRLLLIVGRFDPARTRRRARPFAARCGRSGARAVSRGSRGMATSAAMVDRGGLARRTGLRALSTGSTPVAELLAPTGAIAGDWPGDGALDVGARRGGEPSGSPNSIERGSPGRRPQADDASRPRRVAAREGADGTDAMILRAGARGGRVRRS